MKVVADASVALKWFFRGRDDEADLDQATDLLQAVLDGTVALIEPPHFIAEVAAVLAREAPATAQDNLLDLMAVQMRVAADQRTYLLAVDLAMRHQHHVFDTLYHALALQTPDAVFVTADERYARKAAASGGLVSLRAFTLS